MSKLNFLRSINLFFKHYKILAAIAFLLLILVPMLVLADPAVQHESYKLIGQGALNNPFKPSTSNFGDSIKKYGSTAICFSNSSSKTYFIPNNYNLEWNNFYNAVNLGTVSGVTRLTCCVDGICNGAESNANCPSDCPGTKYGLTYLSGLGGYINGVTSQSVSPGSSGTTVTAVGSYGFVFYNWSDNLSTLASRTDTNVTHSITATAVYVADPCYWDFCGSECPWNCTSYNIPGAGSGGAQDPCLDDPCGCGACTSQCGWNCPGGYWR